MGSPVTLGSWNRLYFSDDHVSEGFLVCWPDGEVGYLARRDIGITGDHIQNGSDIVLFKRPWGGSFGAPASVYSSVNGYDSRNLTGALLPATPSYPDGRLVLMVCEMDVNAAGGPTSGLWAEKRRGTYVTYSDDRGATWSSPTSLTSPPYVSGAPKFKWVPERQQWMADFWDGDFSTFWQHEVWFSDDPTNWNGADKIISANYSNWQLSEGSTAYGEGILVGIIREEGGIKVGAQVVATDLSNPVFSSPPVQTNIAPSWTSEPHVFYDPVSREFITITCTRTGIYANDKMYVATATKDEILAGPTNWTSTAKTRPYAETGDRILNFRMYGYPSAVRLPDNTYMVVVTDGWYDGGGNYVKEGADLYWLIMETTPAIIDVDGFAATLVEKGPFAGDPQDPALRYMLVDDTDPKASNIRYVHPSLGVKRLRSY